MHDTVRRLPELPTFARALRGRYPGVIAATTPRVMGTQGVVLDTTSSSTRRCVVGANNHCDRSRRETRAQYRRGGSPPCGLWLGGVVLGPRRCRRVLCDAERRADPAGCRDARAPLASPACRTLSPGSGRSDPPLGPGGTPPIGSPARQIPGLPTRSRPPTRANAPNSCGRPADSPTLGHGHRWLASEPALTGRGRRLPTALTFPDCRLRGATAPAKRRRVGDQGICDRRISWHVGKVPLPQISAALLDELRTR